jgi:DNA mismatch endonuclease (patch repair protein)
MVDTRTPEQRRRIMQSVAQKHTGPELAVRRLAHGLGFRFALHKDLPGRPDIVFPGRKKVVFVHGCFWHGHSCSKGKLPKTRPEYWEPKIARNKARDAAVLRELKASGWKVLVVWQCDIRDPAKLSRRLHKFLESTTQSVPHARQSSISSRKARGRDQARIL